MLTSVDNPSSNGMNERVNQTIVNRLRCKLENYGNRAWTTAADEVVDKYKRTEHTVVNYATKFLLNGTQEKFSFLEKDIDLERARKEAFEITVKSMKLNKKRLDKMRVDKEIKVNQL